VPEKCERARGKNGLCRVDGYSKILETAQYHADVFDVLFGVRGRDEDVVDVRENELQAGEYGVD